MIVKLIKCLIEIKFNKIITEVKKKYKFNDISVSPCFFIRKTYIKFSSTKKLQSKTLITMLSNIIINFSKTNMLSSIIVNFLMFWNNNPTLDFAFQFFQGYDSKKKFKS